MNSLEFVTQSPEETIAVARSLARQLPAGPVLLIGNLGAGKTTFVKGVAAELLGLPEEDVSSPTFALIHEYGEPVRLYHLDLYRLESAEEVLGIGIEEMMDRPWPMLVEWGERFPDLWPRETPQIWIERLGEERRRIQVEGISQ